MAPSISCSEVSYDIAPSLTKITLREVRGWEPGGKQVSKPFPMKGDVPLFDAPRPEWPCTTTQWASMSEEADAPARSQGQGQGTVNDRLNRQTDQFREQNHQNFLREQENAANRRSIEHNNVNACGRPTCP